MSERKIETDVLIIGAGPVGSSLALELGLHGVRCLVLERRVRRSPQPRAKFANIRTLTLLRRWGVAFRAREAAPLPPGFPSDIAFVDRLTGWELTRFPDAFSTAPDRGRPFPEPGQQAPQDVIEEVLRERAVEFPDVEIARGVEFEGFTEDRDGILGVARETETGARWEIRSQYLAGCDGARSGIREILGIEMEGETLAANTSAVFRAPDLASINDKDPAVHYWVVTPDAPSILGPLDGKDQWWFHLNDVPAGGAISDEEIRRKLFAAVGTEFECEVLANSPWIAERRLAARYSAGRVFLLGDAAHLHPPMGGYGMNMGIGDALDLGWKLAAVLNGWGGAGMLRSYEVERRPIHRRVVEEAAANFANNSNQYKDPNLGAAGEEGDRLREQLGARIKKEKTREWATLGIQLGYRYEGSPIVVADGSPPTPDDGATYQPTSRPGHLLPHGWVDEQRCLYDLLGPEYTLLVFDQASDAEPLVAAARDAGVPLELVEVPVESGLRSLAETDLILVRPDQHVAWRGDEIADAPGIIDRVRGGSTEDARSA